MCSASFFFEQQLVDNCSGRLDYIFSARLFVIVFLFLQMDAAIVMRLLVILLRLCLRLRPRLHLRLRLCLRLWPWLHLRLRLRLRPRLYLRLRLWLWPRFRTVEYLRSRICRRPIHFLMHLLAAVRPVMELFRLPVLHILRRLNWLWLRPCHLRRGRAVVVRPLHIAAERMLVQVRRLLCFHIPGRSRVQVLRVLL